jgi:hypothetical protein
MGDWELSEPWRFGGGVLDEPWSVSSEMHGDLCPPVGSPDLKEEKGHCTAASFCTPLLFALTNQDEFLKKKLFWGRKKHVSKTFDMFFWGTLL